MDNISQAKGMASVAIYRAFAVLAPLKFVGVIGDGCRYEWVIAARWAHLPYELLEKVSNRIINV